jgi:hypothetical protein
MQTLSARVGLRQPMLVVQQRPSIRAHRAAPLRVAASAEQVG